jgi:quinone-modifying oxidoreductase subunit QmoB
MNSGYDGIILMGCPSGDDYQCHFVKGSEIANTRMANIGDTLSTLGLEPERVRSESVAITDYDKVAELVNDFVDEIVELGANPFKGF